MKKYYLILAFMFSFLFALQVNASILKNPFHKQLKKDDQPLIVDPDTLKAKAVYLELEGDTVEYDQESNVYITSGMSLAHLVDQNARLEADEIIYYGTDQLVEAKGNVKVIRDNIVTEGESFKFDVTSNKYLLTNPQTQVKGALIKARTVSSLPDNKIEYEHGRLNLDAPIRIAQGYGARVHPHTFYSLQTSRVARKKPSWDDVSSKLKYRVTAQKIIYNNDKAVNNLTVYGARVHFENFSLPAIPRFTTTVNSDPNVRTAPLIAPTIGTQGALGGFSVGPAFNFNVTDYHILSFSPFAQIGSGGSPGFGAKAGFYGPRTVAELSYGSLKDRFIGQFKQKIFGGFHTEFRSAYNYYLEEGFLGSTLAQINVGLVDRRRWHNSFIDKFADGGVSLRSATSWIKSDPAILPTKYKNFLKDAGDPKDFKNNAFKAEEQISLVSKPLFKLGTEKYNTALRFRTRNAIRAYSTGDFQGVFTGGPLLDNKLGPLSFEIGYDQGYVKGVSPLFYDQYIQGMQSVALDGDVKLSEWVTLGGYGTYNLQAF